MKQQSAKSDALSARCQYRTPSGRQCRLAASGAHSGLCPQHRAEQAQLEAADHYAHLSRNFQECQTALGINHSLNNLYQLLAQNRISPRRASVLAYINSLLLRTLPQIDAENDAGITYIPENLNVANSDPGPGPDSDADPNPGSTNAWDLAILEPDPKKKPS